MLGADEAGAVVAVLVEVEFDWLFGGEERAGGDGKRWQTSKS